MIAPVPVHCFSLTFIQLSNDEEYGLCLLGDFNGHTKEECDYIKMDNDIRQFLNLKDEDNELDRHILEELGHHLQRLNTD